MSLLTADRDTEFVDRLVRDQVPLGASVKVFNGGAVALAGGNLHPAGPGKKHFRGIANQSVDNTGGAAGALSAYVITPEAAWWDPPSGGYTQANVGQSVYFADDHTLTSTGGNNTYAGRIRAVDSTLGILVDHRGAYAELLSPAATTAA